jgi:hypothetical protein
MHTPFTQAAPALLHWLVSEQRPLCGVHTPSMHLAPFPPHVASALQGTVVGVEAASPPPSLTLVPPSLLCASPTGASLAGASVATCASVPGDVEASLLLLRETHWATPFAISQTSPPGHPVVLQSPVAS